MITTDHFASPAGATATVVTYTGMREIVTKTYLHPAVTPHWEERVRFERNRADAEQSARCWAGIYALRLANDYHMQQIPAGGPTP